MEPEAPGLVGGTLRALVDGRRLTPILVVSAGMLIAQRTQSRDPRAVWIGAVMCVGTVLLAPVAWRALMGGQRPSFAGALRLAAFGAIGLAVMLLLGVALPRAVGMGRTLLTRPSSLMACSALFFAVGWSLGRGIELEARMERAEARARALGREAERAQLLALRSHLDPHFLFNTLNAIAEWCREDGETAERAVLQLSTMLRAVLAGVKRASWSLAEELALVQTLLELHRLRDPERFRIAWRMPDPLPNVTVPPMLLLPLAENAVTHGPAAGRHGEIALEVTADASGGAGITLENPGAFTGRRPGGEGLQMVSKLLALAYDGRARLTIEARGDRTRAMVVLPADGPRLHGTT